MSFRFDIFGNTIPEEGFQWGSPGYYIDGYGIPRWSGRPQDTIFRKVFEPRDDYFVDQSTAKPIEESYPQVSLGTPQIGGVEGTGTSVPQLVISQRPLPPPTAGGTSGTTGNVDMAFDLGTLINTVGQAYIANRLAQSPAQTNNPLIPDWIEYGLSGAPVQGPVQPTTTPPTTQMRGYVWDPAADCGAGKWIKRRSRRRRKIITDSDLNQLAALKTIVGNGQALTAAVVKATR